MIAWHLLVLFLAAVPGDKGTVVAIGTGDGCSLAQNVSTDGRTVVDCHAEVIARRAFVKYEHCQFIYLSYVFVFVFVFACIVL